MKGGIKPDAILDYVEFHIFRRHNRYEAIARSRNREEKVASGCLEQLLLHSTDIKKLSSKGSNTKFKILPPDSIYDADWFTTSILTRFLHIIGLPDILRISKGISQLEETNKFQLSLSNKVEADITSIESMNELLLAVDLRLTSLKRELAVAINRVIGSKCSPKDISDLGNFACHFGAKDISGSLQKPVELSTIPSLSSTDDEHSTFSIEVDQLSVERSRTLTRYEMPRRSASPMRRIKIGRPGSRRAAALNIKSLNYFPAREKSASQRDATSNSSEEEHSERSPKNNAFIMIMKDKISLFGSKQRNQSVDIQKTKTSKVPFGTNKVVHRRWSSGMGERATQHLPVPDETSSLRSPKKVVSNGKREPNSNISKTKNCAEAAENIKLLSPESYEKHPASSEWSQQKGAQLNGLFMKPMERKSVRPQKVISDNSKNKFLKEKRGGFYDLYNKKREEKLQGEASGKRVEKDLMLQLVDEKKAKMASSNVTGANKKHVAIEPQKTRKNSTQLINSRTTQTSSVKNSTSKSSPLPAICKPCPLTPSPARTPTGPTSASSTPRNRKPQSSSSFVRSSTGAENLQTQLKPLNATQPDANKRIKAINEKKHSTVTENRKTTRTKFQTPKTDITATEQNSFNNKVTSKSSVVPLVTKPFLLKGSGMAPGVIKKKVVSKPDETLRSFGALIQSEENKTARRIDITGQNQEKECEMQDLQPQVVSPTKCEELESSGRDSWTELGISPSAWVVSEDDDEDEIVPRKESPIQIASPVKATKPASFPGHRVRHSLCQMLLEKRNGDDFGIWGDDEHPHTMVYQKDSPRGLKRLLKFARKAKPGSYLTGWSSPSAFSEGEDDDEEPKATRSFFSLSAFRGNKTNETKHLHH